MLTTMSPDQRSRLFREVNDRIYDLLEASDPDLPGEFLCECGRDCGRRVALVPAAFASLRETGGAVRSSACGEPRLRRRGRRSPLAGRVLAFD
jgi:hypothetical protein